MYIIGKYKLVCTSFRNR